MAGLFVVTSDHYVAIDPLGASSVTLFNLAGDTVTVYADAFEDDAPSSKGTATAGNSISVTDFPAFAKSAGQSVVFQQ